MKFNLLMKGCLMAGLCVLPVAQLIADDKKEQTGDEGSSVQDIVNLLLDKEDEKRDENGIDIRGQIEKFTQEDQQAFHKSIRDMSPEERKEFRNKLHDMSNEERAEYFHDQRAMGRCKRYARLEERQEKREEKRLEKRRVEKGKETTEVKEIKVEDILSTLFDQDDEKSEEDKNAIAKLIEGMSSDDQHAFDENIQDMSPEERKEFRKKLRHMDPEDRRKFLRNRRFLQCERFN